MEKFKVAFALLVLLAALSVIACSQKDVGKRFDPGEVRNDPPVITGGITTNVENPVAGQSMVFYVTATDPQGKALTFAWSDGGGGGSFIGTGALYQFPAIVSNFRGSVQIVCKKKRSNLL